MIQTVARPIETFRSSRQFSVFSPVGNMEEDDGFVFTRKSRAKPNKVDAAAKQKDLPGAPRGSRPKTSESSQSESYRRTVSDNRGTRNDYRRDPEPNQRWLDTHHTESPIAKSHTPSHTRQPNSCRKANRETRSEDWDDNYHQDDRPYAPDYGYDHTHTQKHTPKSRDRNHTRNRRSGAHEPVPQHPSHSASAEVEIDSSSRNIRDRSQRISSRPQHAERPTPRGKGTAPIQSTPSTRTPRQRNIETPRSSGKTHRSIRGGGDSSILSESSISDLRIEVPENLPSESERLRHLLTASMSMVLDHYRSMDSNSYKFIAAEKICKEFIESDPCEIGSSQREVLPNPINTERQTLLDQYQVPLDRLLAERDQWHKIEQHHRDMAAIADEEEVERLSRNRLHSDHSIKDRITREQSFLQLKVEQISQTTKALEYLERSGRDALNADTEEPSGDSTSTTTIPNTRAMTTRATPASEKKTPRRLIRGIIDL